MSEQPSQTYATPTKFDVGKSCIPQSAKIASIPLTKNPVRWHSPATTALDSNINVGEPFTRGDLVQLAKSQRAHMQQLERLGINVPKFATFIGIEPKLPPGFVECSAIYNVVEHVDFVHIDQKHDENIKILLRSYLDWVISTDQSLMMSDIYRDDQFGQTSNGSLLLVDIEPGLLSPSYVYSFGQTALHEAYADIRDFRIELWTFYEHYL